LNTKPSLNSIQSTWWQFWHSKTVYPYHPTSKNKIYWKLCCIHRT